MIAGETSLCNAWSKTSSRVKGTTSEESACELCNEKGQSTIDPNVSPSPRLRSRRATHIPTGAIKVALCFSAASMKMVNTSCMVRNISMKRPWAVFVPADKVVCTAKSPGKRAETTAAEHIAPTICERKRRPPRDQVKAPIKHMPSVTAGLNNPPLILKNVHALTANEKPKASAMYSSLETSELAVTIAEVSVVFAICVAANAKKRKRKVPTNSPRTATM